MSDEILKKLQETEKQLAELYNKRPAQKLQSVIECVQSIIRAVQKNNNGRPNPTCGLAGRKRREDTNTERDRNVSNIRRAA